MFRQSGATYEVATLGARPHNPEAATVAELLRPIPEEEQTILTLKPGYFPNHPRTGMELQRCTEGLLVLGGLEVVCTAEAELSPVDVCELYRDVLPPNQEDDAQFGTGWKRALITYMSGAPVFSYLLSGKNAYGRAKGIKDFLRGLNRIPGDETTKVVENLGHVPDAKDLGISLQILFLGGLTMNNLAESKEN